MGLIWSSSPLRNQPLWLRLSGATLLTLAIFGLSLALGLPQHGSRFLLLYVAVLASALLFGRDAGITATIVGSIAVAVYLALNPAMRVDVAVAMGALLLFLIVGVAMSLLLSEFKRSIRALQAANEQLKKAHSAAVTAEETTDLLLSELRHRVRNDLSNVIAILRLQARSLDQEAAGHLQAAADRLQVLAKLHQALSRHGSSAVVNMKDFLHEISTHFRITMLPLRPVALVSDVEPLKLPSESALPVGLIVNELLTNAIKYAYPDEREGTVTVSLKVDDGMACLEVADDGVGFPASRPQDAPSPSSLGHKLVRSLTGQLRGKFYCESGASGTCCRIVFPVDPQAQSTESVPASSEEKP